MGKIKLVDAPGMMKIVLLHTTLDKVRGILPIPCVEADALPEADYYALGHIHVDFRYKNIVYPGPIFPNNFSELETLGSGSCYIINTEDDIPFEKIDIKLREIEKIEINIRNALTAAEAIIQELENRNLKDKIVLLRLRGDIEEGKQADINFQKIEDTIMQKEAYFVLRNTHDLKSKELALDFEVKNKENVEGEAVEKYAQDNPSKFNPMINDLLQALSTEKQEGETVESFTTRLLDESKRVLKIEE